MEPPEKISAILVAAGTEFNKLGCMVMELEQEGQWSTNDTNAHHLLYKPKRKYKKAALKRKQLENFANGQEESMPKQMLQKVTLTTLNAAEPMVDFKCLTQGAK